MLRGVFSSVLPGKWDILHFSSNLDIASAWRDGLRVLIVEEDVDMCLELSDMLNERGFDTAVANTADKAMQIIKDAYPPPDVILIDTRAKNGEGQWALDILMRHVKCSNATIIEITNNVSQDGRSSAIAQPFVKDSETQLFDIMPSVAVLQ